MSSDSIHPEAIEAAQTINYRALGEIQAKVDSSPPLAAQRHQAELQQMQENVARIIQAAYAPRIERLEGERWPFVLDCLAGKLISFDAVCGYVSQLESDLTSASDNLLKAHQRVHELADERDALRARVTELERANRAASRVGKDRR